MVKDARGHLHDALGRFARTGAQKIRAAEHGERGGNREPLIRRAAAAFQPPTPAAVRRARKAKTTSEARAVRDQYERVAAGRATHAERENISYQSPTKRAESRRRTGDVIMPRGEALRRNVSMVREHPTKRVGVTRTFTGKVKVVRGNGPEIGVRLTSAGKGMIVNRSDLRDTFSKPRKKTARQRMKAGGR